MLKKKNVSSICFGGQTTFNSLTEKHNAFRKSDCLPIMLVPGIMGTRMKVILDCAKLSSEVNNQCSNQCSLYNKSLKPKDRFHTLTLWLSLLNGAAKILNSFDNYCLGMLMKLDIS
jgi:hypothetical protein